MSSEIKSIAVFCGSNFGISDAYAEGARALGRTLAERKITLVYGGTHKGLMGVVADAVLAAGGTAHGIISQRLFDRGHLHASLTLHEITPDMKSRKARMAELADAFVALPGGLGTYEELFEVATLTQLGDHVKACGALNIRNFFEPMRAMLQNAVNEEFMKQEHCDSMIIEAEPDALIDKLTAWRMPTVEKWFAPRTPS
ncbi:TIGR00730 family Rossman fold protein [Uliginosibacterium sp. H3]|uniref:Cytokinin riboside 5'-monophosphate phosphoribohydrolase n=1 Tax=Uliginosibacterium silvisoli TaxID=3114758 RepID=A0ABU6JY63_9RHOO|nr:TIGR00730 family Rossman fold protein [Uliginosibacterium sp. H3]